MTQAINLNGYFNPLTDSLLAGRERRRAGYDRAG